MLDPIADKLLVASVLLVLVGVDRLSGASILPAAIILCREILVSGMREFLAQLQVSLPVTRLSKWKRPYRWWRSVFWWSATPVRGSVLWARSRLGWLAYGALRRGGGDRL